MSVLWRCPSLIGLSFRDFLLWLKHLHSAQTRNGDCLREVLVVWNVNLKCLQYEVKSTADNFYLPLLSQSQTLVQNIFPVYMWMFLPNSYRQFLVFLEPSWITKNKEENVLVPFKQRKQYKIAIRHRYQLILILTYKRTRKAEK